MFEPFILIALAAGIGIALAAGPLGCFVVWRRMAYFGDATSHAAILGVALALLMDTPIILGILITAVGMALAVAVQREAVLAIDTLLGVAAHAALALGLFVISLVPGRPLDLESYLFGDILSLGPTDLIIIWIGVGIVFGILYWHWNALLLSTLDFDLASAEGLKPDRERLVLALTIAVLVAISIKVVGALLITAMLIIPAATARIISQTPERMAMISAGFGAFAVYAGLYLSVWLDTPAGPSIVTIAAATFAITQTLRLLR